VGRGQGGGDGWEEGGRSEGGVREVMWNERR
jgi:hypothetical protein